MLSILIPTYNYKCYMLVHELHEQLEACGEAYEVIVAEDGSRDRVSIISNHRIIELSKCRHIIRKENVGRAKIFNFLVSEAKGEWLMLMDSDAKVVREDFIRKYLETIKSEADVVVGDLINPDTLPCPEVTLRYKYEKSCESWRAAEIRNQNPYSRFCTFNIMAKRTTLMAVPFDERCTEYGYEDTLMGLELKRKGFTVLHIDNPLMHMGFEPNAIYLKKVETSLRTLYKIKDSLEGDTRMTNLYRRLTEKHVLWLVRLCFWLTAPLLRKNMLGTKPSIKVLSFYKLGYYASLK